VGAAMATGKPIVAPRFGAFTERLARYAPASLYPLEASAAQVNDTLVAAAAGEARGLRAISATSP